MSIFLGAPASTKSASIEFSQRGELYRKVDRIDLLDIRITKPLYRCASDFLVFLSQLPWFLMSVYDQKVQVLGYALITPLAMANPWFDFEITLALAFTSALPASLVLTKKLMAKSPGNSSKASHGYISEPMKISAVKSFVADLPKGDFLSDTGVSGQGLHIASVTSLLFLLRLINVFIHGQQEEDMSIGDIDDKTHCGAEVGTISNEGKEDILTRVSDEKWMTSPAILERIGVTQTMRCEMVLLNKQKMNAHVSSPDRIPEEQGHPFVFVPFTMPNDAKYYGDVVMRYFPAFISTSEDVLSKGVDRLRSSIPLLCRTLAGQVALFLLFGIDMAIQSGGILHVIKDQGSVLGMILYTSQPLHIGNILRRSVDADSIRDTVSQWMTQTGALDGVAKLLSGLTLRSDGQTKKTLNRSQISTAPKFLAELAKRNSPFSLDASDIVNISALEYDSFKPQNCSSENIAACFTRIAEGRMPDNCLISSSLFTDDIVVSANLSVFGYTSVSLVNPGGKKIALYAVKSEDPMMGKTKEVLVQSLVMAKKGKRKFAETKETVQFWDRICVSRVPISKAIKDLELIREKHYLYQLSAYDSKILGNVDIHPVSGGDSELLGAIRNFGGKKEDFEDVSKKVRYEEKILEDEAENVRGYGGLML